MMKLVFLFASLVLGVTFGQGPDETGIPISLLQQDEETNPTTTPSNPFSVEFLDELQVPYGFSLNSFPFGGNVGTAYDHKLNLYLILTGLGIPFVKKVGIDIDDSGFCTLNVITPVIFLNASCDLNMTSLMDGLNDTVPSGSGMASTIQPSSIEFFQGHYFWSTQFEECGNGRHHNIRRTDSTGKELEILPLPAHHIGHHDDHDDHDNETIGLGVPHFGVRPGMGFGGISVLPFDKATDNILFAINKGPLIQDGEINNETVAYTRLTLYTLFNVSLTSPNEPIANLMTEYIWPIGPIPYGFDSLEVADIVRISSFEAIVLETAKNSITGQFHSALYVLKIHDSTMSTNSTNPGEFLDFDATPTIHYTNLSNVMANISVDGPIFPCRKIFIRDINNSTLDLSKGLDNLQSMTFGKSIDVDGVVKRVLLTDSNDENRGKPRFTQSFAWTLPFDFGYKSRNA